MRTPAWLMCPRRVCAAYCGARYRAPAWPSHLPWHLVPVSRCVVLTDAAAQGAAAPVPPLMSGAAAGGGGSAPARPAPGASS